MASIPRVSQSRRALPKSGFGGMVMCVLEPCTIGGADITMDGFGAIGGNSAGFAGTIDFFGLVGRMSVIGISFDRTPR